jgi:26S proteasome regulatory subunit N10
MSLGQQDKKTSNMPDLNVMTEEEQLNYALQMSMQQAVEASNSQTITPASTMDTDMKEEDEDFARAMNDPEFLQRVISELPGVDPNSEAVRLAVDALNKDKNQDKDKKEKK